MNARIGTADFTDFTDLPKSAERIALDVRMIRWGLGCGAVSGANWPTASWSWVRSIARDVLAPPIALNNKHCVMNPMNLPSLRRFSVLLLAVALFPVVCLSQQP